MSISYLTAAEPKRFVLRKEFRSATNLASSDSGFEVGDLTGKLACPC